jgi:lipopolysaccharide export system permease protein
LVGARPAYAVGGYQGTMRTLHFYITRQILAGLGMTVLVFTVVLLLGNVLKEVLALLISGQATLGLVAMALALLIPFVLVFALPMGLLTATLLVFGRLSADQELTAARAGGVSLVALASPVLLLGALASCLSAWINLDLAPRARMAYKDLFQRVAVERATDFLEPGRFITDFSGYIVYVVDKRGNQLENVLIYELSEDRTPKRRLQAERAEILTDTVNVEAVLRLYQVTYYDFIQMQSFFSAQIDAFRLSYGEQAGGRAKRTPISDMTFLELTTRAATGGLGGGSVHRPRPPVSNCASISGAFRRSGLS